MYTKCVNTLSLLIKDAQPRIYINFLSGTMSQLYYLEDYQPPSPPRFKPMSLPFLDQISLRLDQSPEDDNLGRCWGSPCGKATKTLSKSSIMKFLQQKPKTASKSIKGQGE